MSAFSGRYYRGAMRDRRQARRTAAETRQQIARHRPRQPPPCTKDRGYRTYAAAAMALLDCRIRRVLRGSRRRRETRIYPCTCGQFHLTSQPSSTHPEGVAA